MRRWLSLVTHSNLQGTVRTAMAAESRACTAPGRRSEPAGRTAGAPAAASSSGQQAAVASCYSSHHSPASRRGGRAGGRGRAATWTQAPRPELVLELEQRSPETSTLIALGPGRQPVSRGSDRGRRVPYSDEEWLLCARRHRPHTAAEPAARSSGARLLSLRRGLEDHANVAADAAVLVPCQEDDGHVPCTPRLVRIAPGMGRRPAKHIVLELKEKLGTVTEPALAAVAMLRATSSARDALVELGYSLLDAERALGDVDPELPAEERVRLALRGAAA